MYEPARDRGTRGDGRADAAEHGHAQGPAALLQRNQVGAKRRQIRQAAVTRRGRGSSNWLSASHGPLMARERRSSQGPSTLGVVLHFDHQAAVIARSPLLNFVHRPH